MLLVAFSMNEACCFVDGGGIHACPMIFEQVTVMCLHVPNSEAKHVPLFQALYLSKHGSMLEMHLTVLVCI